MEGKEWGPPGAGGGCETLGVSVWAYLQSLPGLGNAGQVVPRAWGVHVCTAW